MTTKFSRATPSERKRMLEQRFADLKIKRQPWIEQWKDVAQYISPYSGRFDVGNHGEDRDSSRILDSEAGRCLNQLSSSLLNGASSPTRPWFSLQPPDPELAKNHDVALWCSEVQQMLLKLFQTSNTYNTLHSMYKELALFGIAADVLTDNYDTGIEHHLLSAGEYCVASDAAGNVDTLYREFELTVSQAVKQFGYNNLSTDIKRAYDRGDLSVYFQFMQAIEPRADRDLNSRLNTDMPWASYYMEVGTSAKEIISEGGFEEFPCIVPRWEVLTGEVYGSSPCITILPDVKQLQMETLCYSELLEQLVRPPLQVPQTARNAQLSLQAGALNYTQSTANEQMIRPIVSGNGDLNALLQGITNLKEAIRDGLFIKQFLMLDEAQNNRKTTVEVYALKEEKMLVLGGVVERNNRECLGRLVEMAYHRLLKMGVLPQPPEAIQNLAMEVQFQSVLAQAQKAVDINSVDRMVSAVLSIAQAAPEVIDRIDPDGYVDIYRERLEVDPKFLRSKEDADKIRQQRAEAQQQQAQAEQGQMASQSLSQLAQAQKSGAEASLAQQQLSDIAGGGDLV